MRYMKYLALLAVLMLPVAYSQAQVRIGVGIGGPVYAGGPPVCSYGYYDYYPYACAPYGFYGPDYFAGGIFVGAGPWYHWGHPAEFWGRGWGREGWRGNGRGNWGRGYEGRAFAGRGFVGRGNVGRGEFHGGGSRGFNGGGGFHGGGSVHGGGGFHGGGGGFHGGRGR
jgi:hypothetical protein